MNDKSTQTAKEWLVFYETLNRKAGSGDANIEDVLLRNAQERTEGLLDPGSR